MTHYEIMSNLQRHAVCNKCINVSVLVEGMWQLLCIEVLFSLEFACNKTGL